MGYIWDPDFRVYRRTDAPAYDYTSGLESEQRILQVVRGAADRGTFSIELAQAIVDWPSEYHLSRWRHTLVRPLEIKPEEKVIELGCGGGAITRYLGELGAEVSAVEGSLLRARIAAERCADLPNVTVTVDDISHYTAECRADVVLLIGVHEHVPAFSRTPDPILACLDKARQLLAPNGRLAIAIENRLGLKYLNGCSDDHRGIPFAGVQGLYDDGSTMTLGRKELTAKLNKCGFENYQYYYPFPDYKLPSVIISDAALATPEFHVADLLIRCQARDYTGWPYRSFDEALVYCELESNGLLGDCSNSFFVVSTLGCSQPPTSLPLAVVFSANRVPEFASQTKLEVRDGTIRVHKEALVDGIKRERTADGLYVSNLLGDSSYVDGKQLQWRILRAFAKSAQAPGLVKELRTWFSLLVHNSFSAEPPDSAQTTSLLHLASLRLPSGYLDCTPFNVLEHDGCLTQIDQEWQVDNDISLGWVVARSLVYALGVGPCTTSRETLVEDVMRELCADAGLTFSDSELQGWLEQERSFQMLVSGYRSRITVPSLVTFTEAIRSGENRIATLAHELSTSESVAETLRHLLAEQTTVIQSAHEELAERAAELDRMRLRISGIAAERAAELDRMKLRISEITSDHQESLRRERHNSEMADHLLANMKRLALERDEIRDSLFQQHLQNGTLTSELARSREEAALYHSEYYKAVNSTSWRLTAALRLLNAWRTRNHAHDQQREEWKSKEFGVETADPGRTDSDESQQTMHRAPPALNEAHLSISHSEDVPLGRDAWDQHGRVRLSALLQTSTSILVNRCEHPIVSIILVVRGKANLTLLCIESVLANAEVPFELIIVDNGSSDETAILLGRIEGAAIIHNDSNLGFGWGNFQGANVARSPYLCFLNNDALLQPGSLSAALEAFRDHRVGAVGGKILLADGKLQEAGSIIWSDGTASGYGREDDPLQPCYNFKRPTDFCSGAFLLTPRRLFLRLGGFSPVYSPAYYEDADYCMQLWNHGFSVIYEPNAVIRHFESASSADNHAAVSLMRNHQMKFISRWKDKLGSHLPRLPENVCLARIASESRKPRILIIEDRVPHKNMGSGYPRSNEIVHVFLELGYDITLATFLFNLGANGGLRHSQRSRSD